MGALLLIPALIISLLWYMPGIKLQGDRAVLTKKQYAWCIWVAGVFTTCVLIVVTEIVWDAMVKMTGLKGLPLELTGAFLRAALLEELFKFNGFKMCLDKTKPERKTDFIMLCGLMGLVYGIFEKLFMGGVASIMNALLPMHMMWQLNQGAHYYEYKKAKAEENMAVAKKERLKFIFIPFLFHGCWDAVLSLGGFFFDEDMPAALNFVGLALLIAVVAVGVRYCIKTFKMVKEEAARS